MPRPALPGRQRGIALMAMLVVVIMGIAAMLIGSLNSTALKNEQQKKTAEALAQARDALIGRAVADNNMPGSLPCPDLVTNIPGTNVPNDGIADWLSGNDCPSYIGRLPWKTLRLPDLRDGNNERLWYALSPSFRDDDSARPLNSNTKGALAIYQTDGISLLTETDYSAVAVIFAPGTAIGSQTRNSTADKNNAANYLDIANSRNNAAAAGPFIAGAKSDSFNDQLLFLTTKNLMPLVEQRVASEVKRALTSYYTINGYYPWADNILWGSDNYRANDGELRGWLPNDASAGDAPDWEGAKPPQWFFDNQWFAVIYYSVARKYTEDSGGSNNTLTVNGTNGGRTLFFMSGTPVNPQQRISTTDLGTLSNYLEDSENKDNDDDLYVTPTSQAADRDRLYWLSSSLIWNP